MTRCSFCGSLQSFAEVTNGYSYCVTRPNDCPLVRLRRLRNTNPPMIDLRAVTA